MFPGVARFAQPLALSRNPFGILCGSLLVAVGWLAGTSVSIVEEPQASEYQVKAAFLINFPKYVDWPAEALARTNSPIVIAVLGETKVTGEIQKVIAGRTIIGREIVLKRLASGEESEGCHILFFPGAEQQRSPNLLDRVRGRGVLTVGESNDFFERGGLINLARREGKIALEVNLPAADQARIKVGSKLLGVVSVVRRKSR